MPNNPVPIASRMLSSPTGEMVYIIVERMTDVDIDGEVVRLRAHSHPPGTPKTATFSNAVVVDETGNQYDLRRRYINLLLDYYDKKWKKAGGSQYGGWPTFTFFVKVGTYAADLGFLSWPRSTD